MSGEIVRGANVGKTTEGFSIVAEGEEPKLGLLDLGVVKGQIVTNLVDVEELLADDNERHTMAAQRLQARSRMMGDYYAAHDDEAVLEEVERIFVKVSELQATGLSPLEIGVIIIDEFPDVLMLTMLLDRSPWGGRLIQSVSAAAVKRSGAEDSANPAT